MRSTHAFGGRSGETSASAAPQQPVYPQQPITQEFTSEDGAPGVFWVAASAWTAGLSSEALFAAADSAEEIECTLPAAVPCA